MGGYELIFGLVPAIVIVIFIVSSSVRILREYERGVIFRFGRRANAIFNPGGDGSGPGLVLLMPFVDKMVKVSLRTITMDVPPQDVITRDNVSVKVNAVIFFRVLDANKAVISVEDYLYATSQMAQTTLRSVLGQQELDDLLASREKINEQLTRIIDQHTEPMGGQGRRRRGEERGPAPGHAARHVQAGRGRARAPGQGDQRGRRVPGRGEAGGGGRGAGPLSRSRSSSGIYRPCARSPRSGTPRPSFRCRSICSRRSCARSASPRRPDPDRPLPQAAPFPLPLVCSLSWRQGVRVRRVLGPATLFACHAPARCLQCLGPSGG